MNKIFALLQIVYLLFCVPTCLQAHERHHPEKHIAQLEHPAEPAPVFTSTTDAEKILHWLGNFHPILLHFPIALILMTVVAEILFNWYKNPLFDHAARFMIIAAAISAIPTALFGLAWGYNSHYVGDFQTIFFWHRALGLSTAVLAVLTATLRSKQQGRGAYYICLTLLFILVSLAAFLGGELTFGLNHMALPF